MGAEPPAGRATDLGEASGKEVWAGLLVGGDSGTIVGAWSCIILVGQALEGVASGTNHASGRGLRRAGQRELGFRRPSGVQMLMLGKSLGVEPTMGAPKV